MRIEYYHCFKSRKTGLSSSKVVYDEFNMSATILVDKNAIEKDSRK
ncbi:MAG: hypothetical protein QXL15_04715 [Candidatus Korarchaeota archaeon]